MLWIAVHLPQLSVESFAATVNPAWRERPMALIEAHRITQVDARAAQLGIHLCDAVRFDQRHRPFAPSRVHRGGERLHR